tara:strand:+ start:114 stop:1337 length:1224 start_codon:yes stop_codon:yes gene_type:complete
MEKLFLALVLIFGILVMTPMASAQLFEKVTFQETATIIYDQKLSKSIITSIGFETTDNEEIRIPDELVKKIESNEEIRAVLFTNAGECVIGVTSEQQCIMINFDYQRLKGDGGIRQVQDTAREMSGEIIDDLKEIFGNDAEFHSTFIHTVDDTNMLLETSGTVSGRGAVSATYVMPKQSTDFLFADLAGKLIPKEIREAGGFYSVSKELAKEDDSIISISMIKNGDENLFMFKVAKENKDAIENITKIDPLSALGIKEISRSNIFDERNVPLNSVIQLIVLTEKQSKIDAITTHAITDVTTLEGISKKGWFFSNPAGDVIDAKFLFGQDKIATHGELVMEIGPWDGESEMSFYSVEDIPKQDYESIEEFGRGDQSEGDESQYAVLAIIIAIGIGAAIFYLKGYKPKR